jgi:hypothetical protein
MRLHQLVSGVEGVVRRDAAISRLRQIAVEIIGIVIIGGDATPITFPYLVYVQALDAVGCVIGVVFDAGHRFANDRIEMGLSLSPVAPEIVLIQVAVPCCVVIVVVIVAAGVVRRESKRNNDRTVREL